MTRRPLSLSFVSVGAALFAAPAAMAVDVTVAEFSAMTRITIPASEEAEWAVKNTIRSIDLTAAGAKLNMIAPSLPDDSRLSALDVWAEEKASRISIHFSCDCSINHFLDADGAVIIDISEKIDRADPIEQVESTEQTEPTELVEKAEPTEKAEKAEPTEKAEKAEPNEKAEKAEPNEMAEKAEPTEKAEKAEPNEKAEKAEPNEKAEKAEPNEKAEKAEPTEKAEKAEPNEKAEKAEPTKKAEKAEPTEKVAAIHATPRFISGWNQTIVKVLAPKRESASQPAETAQEASKPSQVAKLEQTTPPQPQDAPQTARPSKPMASEKAVIAVKPPSPAKPATSANAPKPKPIVPAKATQAVITAKTAKTAGPATTAKPIIRATAPQPDRIVPAAATITVTPKAKPKVAPTRLAQANTQPKPKTQPKAEVETWRLANVLVATPQPRRKPDQRPNRKPERTAVEVTESTDPAIDSLRDSILETLALGVEQGRITMDTVASEKSLNYVPAGCPDENALDLKRLIGSRKFREAIPSLRSEVYDEMKQVNPAAVRDLARHFVAFGLGEEARNVLSAFDTKGAPERLILDMASVLEGNGSDIANSVLVKPDCGPRAAVWRAMVAAEGMDGTVREAYEKASKAIFDVPGPLRKILGARIALGLIDEGDRESAMRLWRNLQVAEGPHTPEMLLLAAYARYDNPLNSLINLSERNLPIAGEAAIRAGKILMEGGDRAKAERLGAVLDDLAFIYRDTEYESDLSLAHAKLKARYGDLAAALTVLAKKADDQPERAAHWRSIAHNTIQVATKGADPVARPHDFDTILASLKYLDDSPESDAAKFSLTRKLMNVGGAHIVESVLKPDIMKRSAEARRIVAEARLLMGDAAGAQKLLKGMKDEDSAALKERMTTLIGNTGADTARSLFTPVGRPPEEASISAARDLMNDADADLSIIEELLADG